MCRATLPSTWAWPHVVEIGSLRNSADQCLIRICPKKLSCEDLQSKQYKQILFFNKRTKNQSKWKAATEYCLDRGWEFKIITEKELKV